ncbi:MAG TPA: hypothetical protein PLB91_14710 [Spirochaetales bacterium]|nr:hypothetical protein [Spirochaetales bacterium]HRY56080.1 hypothetical protein [Spirochaetia bacterium]HRZ66102.1 hypothetical protein [Spirochaetia bacterium]
MPKAGNYCPAPRRERGEEGGSGFRAAIHPERRVLKVERDYCVG